MLPTILTERASKTIVSCEASSKFHRTSFENDRFVRCFRQFSQRKLPKRSFRARLPPNLTEQASKTNVSCEASFKFHRTSFQNDRFALVSRDASDNFNRKSFQNDRFVRGFLQISQNKLPKRSFRAMLPTILTERASKTIVSCEASSKFHRTSFENDRFVRCFRQFSQRKLPKRSFRAMLPTILTERASKTIVSCEASSKFHRTSFQNDRFARCFRQF